MERQGGPAGKSLGLFIRYRDCQEATPCDLVPGREEGEVEMGAGGGVRSDRRRMGLTPVLSKGLCRELLSSGLPTCAYEASFHSSVKWASPHILESCFLQIQKSPFSFDQLNIEQHRSVPWVRDRRIRGCPLSPPSFYFQYYFALSVVVFLLLDFPIAH